MHITVKLFASFRNGRFAEELRSCPDACTAGQVLAELGIAEDEASVILLNGRHISSTDTLSDGDTLSVFPVIGGG